MVSGMLAFVELHWVACYFAIGVMVACYVVLSGGLRHAGWVRDGSGPAVYSGGLQVLWVCVLLWLPVLLIRVLPASVKRSLSLVGMGSLLWLMLLWPIPVVAYLVWKWLESK